LFNLRLRTLDFQIGAPSIGSDEPNRRLVVSSAKPNPYNEV